MTETEMLEYMRVNNLSAFQAAMHFANPRHDPYKRDTQEPFESHHLVGSDNMIEQALEREPRALPELKKVMDMTPVWEAGGILTDAHRKVLGMIINQE